MTRPRTPHAVSACVLALVLALSMVAACTPEQDRANVVLLINKERATYRLGAVEWNDELGDKAQLWSEHLADSGKLGHSVLSDGVSVGWRALGENVGYGDDIGKVHVAFMNSPAHREAILNGVYRAIGIGIAQRGDQLYIVEVFKA